MSVPTWVQDSVFYQIFPDRFANGKSENDPKAGLAWSAKPTIYGFQGGDLRGIIQRMYYLLDLGVNAIYLNPIFLSPSNHRYNAIDYFQLDPKLGTKADFLTLLDVAHRNEMKIILDGVFNHCGRGFFAFNDILENQAESPYLDWFHIRKFPVDAYSPGDATTFEGWWKYKSLPKFNTANPDVQKYILNVARYWIEHGIDGWRLDVPNEIDDDLFWYTFRQVVKNANPDAYLLGEIWDGDKRWVGHEHFDGLMNYPVRTLVLDLLTQKTSLTKFAKETLKWLTRYPRENAYAMYGLLGSHDTERFLTKIDGHLDKAKLGYLFLMTYPGAPAIYYGDEIGMLGAGDPDCRGTFQWDESQWNIPLRNWIKKLIRLRKDKVALRRGDYQILKCDDKSGALVYLRREDSDCSLIAMNISDETLNFEIDISAAGISNKSVLRNMLALDEYEVVDQKITIKLPCWSGVLLFPK